MAAKLEVSGVRKGAALAPFLFLSLLGYTEMARAAKSHWESTCPTGAHELEVTIQSVLELRTAFLPKDSNERAEWLNEAALQQVRYYQKSLEERWKAQKVQLVFSGKTPVIDRFLEKEAGAGSLAYEVTPVEHPDVKIEHPYLKGALASGHLPKSDSVLRLRFRARAQAMSCGDVSKPPTAALAPLDPFLVFWTTPKKDRRVIAWQHSRFELSPLFDAEYSDIPDPFFGWYFWRPEGKGEDANGLPYDSKQFRDGITEGAVSVRVVRELPRVALRKPKDAKQPLRITLIYGVVDAKRKIWRPEDSFAHQKGGAGEWAENTVLVEDALEVDDLDRGSRYALDFLRSLSFALDVQDFRFEKDKDLLSVRGRLPRTGRLVSLRFFFGPTDLLVQEPPRHWQLASEALSQDDIVVYNGHSGLGENFRLENIEKFAGKKVKPKRDQILAILSCYSYSYNTDYQRPNQLLLTGSDYTSARGGLGLLHWADQKGFSFVEPQDFLLLRHSR